MSNARTTEQLQRAVSVICRVIGQIPCFHIYEEHIEGRFATDQAERALMAMMHNASLDSALLNLRCFNEFFKPDGRQDDIRAYHFHGLSMQPFLSPDEEQSIHKHLAHLTVTRSDMTAKPWRLDEMTIHALLHGIQFLSFIDAQFPMHTEDAYAELRGVRDGANRLVKRIVKRQGSQNA